MWQACRHDERAIEGAPRARRTRPRSRARKTCARQQRRQKRSTNEQRQRGRYFRCCQPDRDRGRGADCARLLTSMTGSWKAFMRVRPALQRRIVALVNEIAGRWRNARAYEGISFEIRAGLGRNEWSLLIAYPDRASLLSCRLTARGMTPSRPRIVGSVLGSGGNARRRS